MSNILISIITTVFNKEEYLSISIESVLNQTYKNFEWIIINDGSTDNSDDVIKSYCDSRIRYVSNINLGQSKASNHALKMISGDYIKFFDADDVMNSSHLEEQLKETNGRNNILVSCSWGRFYNNKPESAIFEPELVWKDLLSIDWMKNSLRQKSDMMPAWLWLIPKEVIQKAGGWNDNLTLNNDFEFSMRLLSSVTEVKFVPQAKMYYRSGISSLSTMQDDKSILSNILSCELGCSYLLTNENTPETRQLCANRFQELIFRVYPHNMKYINYLEEKVKELGGSKKNMEGGIVFSIFRFCFGWKFAKKFKLLYQRIKA
jgi:glycosyltransferase involved in cell wall biosynthesis